MLETVENVDLLVVGMRADAIRKTWHPEGIVTYSTEPPLDREDIGEVELLEDDLMARLSEIRSKQYRGLRLTLARSDVTAVEALQLIATVRIQLEQVCDIELSADKAGLKLTQVALRFGVNDLGFVGNKEEQIRRLVRDAGFVPKRRREDYRAYDLT